MSFTIPILPDTQAQSQNFPSTFNRNTKWIADNSSILNMPIAVHLGDVVQGFNNSPEWVKAKEAMARLNIPFSILPGNTDQSISFNKEKYNIAFPPNPQGQSFPDNTNDNSYHLFEADDLEFLVFSLEFLPNPNVFAWMDSIIDLHPSRKIIVSTHGMLDMCGNFSVTHSGDRSWIVPGIVCPAGHSPNFQVGSTQYLWDAFKKYDNLFLILCGHEWPPDLTVGGSTRRTDLNDAGDEVNTIMQNFQHWTDGGIYIRLYEFDFAGGFLNVKTFAPATNQHLTDPSNEFTLAL